MAVAKVQQASANAGAAGTTVAATFGSNNTSGNLLVATVTWWRNATTTTCSVADTANGAWTAVGTPSSVTAFGLNLRSQVFYKANCAAGANTVTATTSGTVDDRSIAVFEFSGCATSSVLDNNASGSGSSATPSFDIATVDANSLIVGCWWNGNTFGAGANYTAGPAPEGHSSQYDLDAGAGGTVAFNCTQAASAAYTGSAAAFLIASGGGGTPAPKLLASTGVGT